MGKLSLPLQVVGILASVIVARPPAALGLAAGSNKCKCFMCVCDFDPHPLPPELPSHHHPAPPTEPEHHSPPPELEPERVLSPPPPALPEPEHYYPPPALPEPEHYYPPPVEHHEPAPEYNYYPPPAYGYYPSVGLPYYPPSGEMYPRDKASKSGAHRRPRGHRSLLAAVLVLASAVLSSSSLLARPGCWW